jgi:hypothetical protein
MKELPKDTEYYDNLDGIHGYVDPGNQRELHLGVPSLLPAPGPWVSRFSRARIIQHTAQLIGIQLPVALAMARVWFQRARSRLRSAARDGRKQAWRCSTLLTRSGTRGTRTREGER